MHLGMTTPKNVILSTKKRVFDRKNKPFPRLSYFFLEIMWNDVGNEMTRV